MQQLATQHKSDKPTADRAKGLQRVEAVAKAIFWEMNSVMHDHAECWKRSDKKALYRDCAKAALVALAHYPEKD